MLRVRSSLSYPALGGARRRRSTRSPRKLAAARAVPLLVAVFSTALSSFAMGWACVQLNSATSDASARGTLRLSDARLTACTGVLYLAAALSRSSPTGRSTRSAGARRCSARPRASSRAPRSARSTRSRRCCSGARSAARRAASRSRPSALLTGSAPAAHRGRVVYLGPVAAALGRLACSAFGWWACVALDGGWRCVTAALAAPAALQLALGALGVRRVAALPAARAPRRRARRAAPAARGRGRGDAALRAELLGEGFGGDGGGGGGGGGDGGGGRGRAATAAAANARRASARTARGVGRAVRCGSRWRRRPRCSRCRRSPAST